MAFAQKHRSVIRPRQVSDPQRRIGSWSGTEEQELASTEPLLGKAPHLQDGQGGRGSSAAYATLFIMG